MCKGNAFLRYLFHTGLCTNYQQPSAGPTAQRARGQNIHTFMQIFADKYSPQEDRTEMVRLLDRQPAVPFGTRRTRTLHDRHPAAQRDRHAPHGAHAQQHAAGRAGAPGPHDGQNACWVPGMDHASIATEAKVVAKLQEEGIEKSSLTREEFLRHAWEWKEKYGGMILRQLRKLGASCDWERTAFTMDDPAPKASSRSSATSTKKAKSTAAYAWSTGIPRRRRPCRTKRSCSARPHGKLYYLRYLVEGT